MQKSKHASTSSSLQQQGACHTVLTLSLIFVEYSDAAIITHVQTTTVARFSDLTDEEREATETFPPPSAQDLKEVDWRLKPLLAELEASRQALLEMYLLERLADHHHGRLQSVREHIDHTEISANRSAHNPIWVRISE